ncbi:uncharacterized protein LOC108044258 [Drosophila rhopaloa]|uniref:Uncharacterized protein LOC108044258 n=1 Tax=Drosophila rhopaloa TaxID=1041015 RepID=A0A6P4F056_DRORH|nr:uncharacterized protein LOC108044258 [Drosophila rhopaloa]
MGTRFYILLMLIGEAYMIFPKTYEASFISFNSNGTEYADFSKIRFLGRERMANGTLELKLDLDDKNFSVSGESFLDSTGSGEYKQLPFTIPKQPICQALESNKIFFEASLKRGVNTDFPIDTNPCPVPKGIYYFKDVLAKTDNWPSIMPRGYFKAVAKLFKNDELVAALEIVVRITDLP